MREIWLAVQLIETSAWEEKMEEIKASKQQDQNGTHGMLFYFYIFIYQSITIRE